MKLRDIVLSATIGLGLIGCGDKKVESLYNPNTFPKADSVVVDSDPSSKYIYYSNETGFKDGLKREKYSYKFNAVEEKLDTISVTRWFYNDKGREIRVEYDLFETKGLDQVDNIRYDKNNEWIHYIDYGANGRIEQILTSPGYEK